MNRRHGGAPRGSKNGNYKHGDWTTDAIAERKWLRALVQSFADNGPSKMDELRNPPASIPEQHQLPPVRVKLQRPDAYQNQTCPPDGEIKDWEARLNKALGTVSPDFSLLQLQGAARSPYGTISETAINAALAMIEAAAPRDELEGALAVQMACCHAAATAVIGKLQGALLGSERRIAVLGSTAARLMKAFAMQMEVRRRLRIGGHQFVRVEHVHINDGGQAVIGNVRRPGRHD
jgi:hypothetical protein